VQKPLAVVVVGGMMLAPIIILITLPVLILMISRRTPGVAVDQAVPAPAQ
jgi:cobalt-zinc-cadmium resistance protein CzcA